MIGVMNDCERGWRHIAAYDKERFRRAGLNDFECGKVLDKSEPRSFELKGPLVCVVESF